MSRLAGRIEARDGRPTLKADGRPVADVIAALEAGAPVVGLGPLDLVAALAFAALGDEGPELVQRRPARPGLLAALSDSSLARVFPDASRPERLALSAGLLQAHDFWEPSHEAAQEADDLGERRYAAYWHGIAHRREPDAGNASYWFRRVGNHPVFTPLAEEASALLNASEEAAFADRLARGGWDPYAMIDLCTRSAKGSPQAALARRLQRLEMGLLLDACAAAVAG